MDEHFVNFACPHPFVVLEWPFHGELHEFAEERQARNYLASLPSEEAGSFRIFGYSNGKWNRL